MAVTTAALLSAGCGGSNGSDNASGTASSSQPSTVNPSDMSNEQAPPTRLVVDVTIKDGNVTPTNEQLQAAVNEQIIVRSTATPTTNCTCTRHRITAFNVEAKPGPVVPVHRHVPGKVDVELHKANKTVATIAVQ